MNLRTVSLERLAVVGVRQLEDVGALRDQEVQRDILPAAQTGTYSDVTGNKGKSLYTHFLCEGAGLFGDS